jgi:putative ABC transport system substrate-binding protein
VLAADLVGRRVAVIYASGTPAALAAKAATPTIPVVFGIAGDPVALGLVASLNRPNANLTGYVELSGELASKRLQLLRELLANVARFGVLVDPANVVSPPVITDLQAAARILGLQLVVVDARTDSDLETAFIIFSQQRVGAVLIGLSTIYNRRIEKLAALAARHALPASFAYREFALAGGVSYGSSAQVGIYTGRVLRGEKPADFPVQQITKIDLVINLKTAKALGLTIPETLLATGGAQ